MKKRLLISFILLFLCTGCKIEYHLDIDEKLYMDEETKIIANNENELSKINEFNYYIPISSKTDDYGLLQEKIDGVKYYSIKKNKDNIIFKNNFSLDEYKDSTLLSAGEVSIATANPEEKIFMLSTESAFKLFKDNSEVEELKVVIHTNYEVMDNNADEVENHNYIWIFTPDNYEDRYVYLKVDTSKENLSFTEKLLRGDFLNIFTLSIILAVISLIIFLILKARTISKNKI